MDESKPPSGSWMISHAIYSFRFYGGNNWYPKRNIWVPNEFFGIGAAFGIGFGFHGLLCLFRAGRFVRLAYTNGKKFTIRSGNASEVLARK